MHSGWALDFCVACFKRISHPSFDDCAALLTLLAVLSVLLNLYDFRRRRSRRGSASQLVGVKGYKLEQRRMSYLFPACRAHIVDAADAAWWAETIARLYEVDFAPGVPPTVPVKQLHQLSEQQGIVRKAGFDDHATQTANGTSHDPIDDIWVARALIASDFNVMQASKIVATYVKWRKSSSLGLVWPEKAWIDYAIVIVPFEDKRGRPVAISRLRSYHPGLPIEMMTNGYRATADGVIAHMLMNRSAKMSRTNPLEQWVLCIDCEGISFQNFSMAYVKMFVHESAQRYMERIGAIYMLNPPTTCQIMWSMLKPVLHPRTLRKIKFVPAKEVRFSMFDLLGERAHELLPPAYGGHAAPFPPPGEGKNLEEKVGALLAKTWLQLGMDLSSSIIAEDAVPASGPCKLEAASVKRFRNCPCPCVG